MCDTPSQTGIYRLETERRRTFGEGKRMITFHLARLSTDCSNIRSWRQKLGSHVAWRQTKHGIPIDFFISNLQHDTFLKGNFVVSFCLEEEVCEKTSCSSDVFHRTTCSKPHCRRKHSSEIQVRICLWPSHTNTSYIRWTIGGRKCMEIDGNLENVFKFMMIHRLLLRNAIFITEKNI